MDNEQEFFADAPGRRKEALTADRPPGRFGLPEEVSAMAALLASMNAP
ncbi:hypothetical protein [Sinorhizobium sp. M4_45]|nr:hypothetical protein [Sinorhizobium sp. M4_45]